MATITQLPALAKERRADIQEIIDDLQKRLNDETMNGLSVVIENTDATYCVKVGSSMSRLQTAGALLEAAIRRLD